MTTFRSAKDLVGTELAGLRLMSFVGEGGMAWVFRGENVLQPGILRAVKVLKPELAADPEFRNRFAREAEAVERLRHPGVVGFYGLRADQGYLVIEQELLEGEDLQSHAAKAEAAGHLLPMQEVLGWIEATAEALGAVHAAGMVHRDIKPSNIFLTTAGQVKILDFGLARTETNQSRTGTQAVGTVAYMAPEIVKGGGAAAVPASDVYGLALTAWELLAGEHPFAGKMAVGEYALMNAQVHDAVPDLRTIRGETPDWVGEALVAALKKDPAERIVDGAAFAAALHDPSRATGTTPSRRTVAATRAERGPSRVTRPISGQTMEKRLSDPRAPTRRSGTTATLAPAAAGVGAGVLAAIVLCAGGLGFAGWMRWSSTRMASPPVAALTAMRFELGQDGLLADAARSKTLQDAACQAGYTPSCEPRTWSAAPTTAERKKLASDALASRADGGDPLAKVVQGWALSQRSSAAPDAPPSDPARAAALFKEVCDAGYLPGCTYLGAVTVGGVGVKADPTGGTALFRKACDGGDASGCTELGLAYTKGVGVVADPGQAAKLLQQACDAGSARGCDGIGGLYAIGAGVPVNPAHAVELYQHACTLGAAEGCNHLAQAHADGVGVAKDLAQAAAEYQLACDGGINAACVKVGLMYLNGAGVPADPSKALAFLGRPCEPGDPEGCAAAPATPAPEGPAGTTVPVGTVVDAGGVAGGAPASSSGGPPIPVGSSAAGTRTPTSGTVGAPPPGTDAADLATARAPGTRTTGPSTTPVPDPAVSQPVGTPPPSTASGGVSRMGTTPGAATPTSGTGTPTASNPAITGATPSGPGTLTPAISVPARLAAAAGGTTRSGQPATSSAASTTTTSTPVAGTATPVKVYDASRAFKVHQTTCPTGSKLVATSDAQASASKLCSLLAQWDIARLAGGGSFSGPGYGCVVKASDTGSLGDALCWR